jgi:hypothetical protein
LFHACACAIIALYLALSHNVAEHFLILFHAVSSYRGVTGGIKKYSYFSPIRVNLKKRPAKVLKEGGEKH